MKLNRRQLIGGAAVMAAMPGIPSAFAAVKEETRDLVIVGGGLGGLPLRTRPSTRAARR